MPFPKEWSYDQKIQKISSNFKSQAKGGEYYWKIFSDRAAKVSNLEGKRGGVILMHSINKKSVSALKEMLEYAKKEKLQFVKLEEVEEYNYGERCF